MNQPAAELATSEHRPRGRAALLETALVFAVFFLQGGWPAPDVNESVYLAKIKHEWNPDWSPRDFYLNSTDAHAVFGLAVGWLTRFLSLPAFAWYGRLITWWLMAWSWQRLSFALAPRWWLAVVSAGLFVCLQERCQMAGEWVIGGFEAKGLAYVLVFLGLEMLVRNRWNRALWMWGAAAAFHVLVGGWTVVAAGLAWLSLGKHRPTLTTILPGLAGGLMLALPALWLALQLNAGADAETVREANRIYVFDRLPHHLAPQSFPKPAIFRHVLLVAAAVALFMLAPRGGGRRRLLSLVLGAAVVAAIGAAIALATSHDRALAAPLLRLYWFRLSDALVPLGVALGAIAHLAATSRITPLRGQWQLGLVSGVAALHLAGYAVDRPFPTRPRADKENKVADYIAWRHVCGWVEANTPVDALFLTPRTQQTFKWYSGRSEVATWKGLPQNAAHIVEWWRRLNEIHRDRELSRWRDSLNELSPQQLQQLGQEYQARYLLTEAQPRLALELLYQNNAYAVYRLD